MALPSIALPGTLLGPAAKFLPGPGTHIHDSHIYASIAGPVVSSATPTPASSKPKPLPLLSISRNTSSTTTNLLSSGAGATILPEVESIILARVTRLTPRYANIEILCVSDTVCREPFAGMIRREDIRATEKDKVKMEESFRVGDLVRGMVVSLGDQSNYYVTTARNDWGVVVAKSAEGMGIMAPVSWKEVVDVRTGRRERRKVAKPF
ncbi:hypothetical protein P280DRAFT_10555 [Massarina eburnea CBS 473.64]|uniref:RNA-binding domain-containing protein n=1 Tax=Massarina eburnea CBS 473.64 TaxID=1395130 RepID=A0A6A6SHL8_9PLEO|nr:hypothetical protein P280DRAFT_10555 [Massarina eburnea CBS 473.64]